MSSSSTSSSSSELYQRMPLLPNDSTFCKSNNGSVAVNSQWRSVDSGGDSDASTRILIESPDVECDAEARNAAGIGLLRNCHSDESGMFSLKSNYSATSPQRDIAKVDMPTPTRDELKFPKDRFKTFTAGLFFVVCGTINMISLSIVHDRVPDREKGALPDIILDNIQANDWALFVAEYILMVLTYFCVLVSIFHKHRWIVFRRCFFLLGVLYLYRSVTMFVTVLPVASKTYECKEKANSTSVALVAHRTFELLLGLGLSINGHHKYCGDYIYSGHTMILVLGALVVKEYTPRRWWPLHWLTAVWSFAGVLMILYSRGHYTVDVILAYYITTRLFWLYHTFANNAVPRKANNENNLLARVWWFWFFCYLEKNTTGAVPRVYQWPIPFSRICRWLRYRNEHRS